MAKYGIDAHLGTRIKLRRTILGLSQEAVAKRLGITFQQVQKYEKGTNALSAKRLMELSRALGVSVAYFFEGWDEANGSQANIDNEVAPDRESLEMMKAFKRINEPVVRKRLSNLVRAIANDELLIP